MIFAEVYNGGRWLGWVEEVHNFDENGLVEVTVGDLLGRQKMWVNLTQVDLVDEE